MTSIKNKLKLPNTLGISNSGINITKKTKNNNRNNYPPLERTVETNKKELIKLIKKSKEFKKGKTKKITAIKKILSKKVKTDIEWGLGVEHEFMMCLDISKIKNNIVEILEDFNGPLTTNEKKKINTIIKSNKKYYYIIPYIHDFGMKEVNIEASGANSLPMYEIKNMTFHNVNLNDVIQELSNQRVKLNENLQKELKLKINRKINPVETEFGAEHLLFNSCSNNDYFSYQENPGYQCLGGKNIKTDIDYTGSYHFWITLPHNIKEPKENINLLHQKSIFLLQTIEPLLCALFGSCDPTITKSNKNRLIRGSYRTANNMYANYGIAPGYNYESNNMFTRVVRESKISSRSLKLKTYLNQMRNKLREPFKISNIPNYTQFVGDYEPWGYGTDFRRKYGIKGFEFRIWDHFPQKHLSDVLKIVYLIATHAYDIDTNHLTYPFDNQSWNNSMFQCLMYGYQAKIEEKYSNFLKTQFQLDLTLMKMEPSSILTQIINFLYDKVLNDSKHHYWTLVGETPNNHQKPKLINFNKLSQEAALKKY
jgi:hypothetical protein